MKKVTSETGLYANAPVVDARYWTVIAMASVFGCNLGDFVSLYLKVGHWRGLFPLALVFAVLQVAERRSHRATEAWYWALVIVLRTAATNLADLGTHTWEWPYVWVIAGLAVFQILMVLPTRPRRFDQDGAGRPVTNAWYWLSLLTAGTLGTAIGDDVAEEFDVGTGFATVLLGAIFALVLGWGRRARWSTKTSYWLAIIAVRSAGTTAGDWLAFREAPGLANGLALGLPWSTVLTGGVFIGTLLLWRRRKP